MAQCMKTCLFGRELSEEEVLEALDRAQAMEIVTEIVDSLPLGLNTPLQEQGGNLSIGQAQRIALARAIARPVKLLILDEPTASLDSHNERLVLDTLESIPEDCTVITVTHRLGQLDKMDRILMLDNGQLIADGDPESLRDHFRAIQGICCRNAGEPGPCVTYGRLLSCIAAIWD